jgi:hypothetical protein
MEPIAALHTDDGWLVDPAGFEPAIFCVQSRRLPARPRAHDVCYCLCRREDLNLHTPQGNRS